MDSAVVILLLSLLLYAPFRHEELRIEGSEFDTVLYAGTATYLRLELIGRYFNLP